MVVEKNLPVIIHHDMPMKIEPYVVLIWNYCSPSLLETGYHFSGK